MKFLVELVRIVSAAGFILSLCCLFVLWIFYGIKCVLLGILGINVFYFILKVFKNSEP